MSKVYLIGAGPGAADLITVRGMRILEQAEIVFYDALVQEEMLSWCSQAKQVQVGKRCGRYSSAQHFINKQLVDATKKYTRIVRLKGGDPMMFGRADEELSALEQAGIAYEVVPGVTAALAAAASIAQPLTKRGVSRQVRFVTQATADNQSLVATPLDPSETVVYYMGRRQAQSMAQDLLKQGWSSATPVWVLEAVSTPHEYSMSCDIGALAQGCLEGWGNVEQPTLIMLGQALALRNAKPIYDHSVLKQSAQ